MVTILILDNSDFKFKLYETRGRHFLLIKWSVYLEKVTLLNIYTPESSKLWARKMLKRAVGILEERYQ